MGPSESMEVDACSCVLAIPIFPDIGDWCAVEQTCHGESKTICEGDSDQGIHRLPQFFARKDSETEEQERHLGESQGYKVEYLSEPCELGSISIMGQEETRTERAYLNNSINLLCWDGPNVFTETISSHEEFQNTHGQCRSAASISKLHTQRTSCDDSH